MPYQWSDTSHTPNAELRLWPHNALSQAGLAWLVLLFFLAACIPLMGFVGSIAIWGLLPFMLLATWALNYALSKNKRDRQIVEVLTVTPETTRLERRDPKGSVQDWEGQTYWVKVTLHEEGGPVPNYVTLRGGGREVEIGAFLSEEERKALYHDLRRTLAR
jgi:uncharacterized membrane protein